MMTKAEAKQIVAAWLASSKGEEGQCGYIEGWFYERDAEAFRMAIEALQDDWTSFSDDSAVLNYEVMCQDRHGNMMLGYVWVDNYGVWMCEDDNTIMDDVVAWRPLPKPYKENEQ